MERIGEQHQPTARQAVGREHRGDAAAHRSAAEEERERPVEPVHGPIHDRSVASLERRHRIRAPQLPFAVEEVEGDDLESGRRKDFDEAQRAGVAPVSAGAWAEEEKGAAGAAEGRVVVRRRR
jgi:hypothetical protein